MMSDVGEVEVSHHRRQESPRSLPPPTRHYSVLHVCTTGEYFGSEHQTAEQRILLADKHAKKVRAR